MHKGRVVKSTGSWYNVYIDGNVVKCRLPGRFRLEEKEVTNPIAVGDWVFVVYNDDGTGSIEEIEERNNYITRKATNNKRGEQILASNLDIAFAVQSIRRPKLNEGFINRFLASCEAYDVNSGIIINKMDLATPSDVEFLEEMKEIYAKIGYPIFETSIEDQNSINLLKEFLKDKTSAFIGPSGVGKTSLLNAVDPNFSMKVGAVSDYSNKGKHTTTFAQLIALETGGFVVDTPGIREFGLVNIEPWELSLYFPEMLEPRKKCKFNTCTHVHEPGCGVQEAFDNGEIDPNRFHSYLNILDSLEN